MLLALFPVSSLMMFFFFFNDTATTEIYTLSLHDALPILFRPQLFRIDRTAWLLVGLGGGALVALRSEEHTSELQSQSNLVCRLLLEKKKNVIPLHYMTHHHRSQRRYHSLVMLPHHTHQQD